MCSLDRENVLACICYNEATILLAFKETLTTRV